MSYFEVGNLCIVSCYDKRDDQTIKPIKINAILTSMPSNNISIIDTTSLSPEQVSDIVSKYEEYIKYKDTFMSNMLSFDGWLDNSYQTGDDMKIPYKSLKLDEVINISKI